MNAPRPTRRVVALFVLLAVAPFATAAEELVMGVLPYLGTTDLLRRFTPLTDHLAKAVGRPVRIRIAEDYLAHIRLVGENRVDLAYLGPVSYVELVRRYGPRPILARLEENGGDRFRGVIITRRESPLHSLQDLADRRVAFGDLHSTMGHLAPRFLMLKAGVTPARLAEYEHMPNHRSVVLAVLTGMVDAGAVMESVYLENEAKGLKALAWTQPMANYLFVARPDLPSLDTLRQSLLGLAAERYGPLILRAITPAATGLGPGSDQDYDDLRAMLAELAEIGVTP